MSDSLPVVSLSAIEARAAQRESKEILATQVLSEERFEEGVDTGFNPAAAQRQQERLNRFKALDARGKTLETKERKIQEVGGKADAGEDMLQDFTRRNPELDPDRLRRLKEGLREGMTPDQILKEVEEAFPDPTLADEAMDFLERSSEGALKEAVQKARTILTENKGREIIAGRNIAPMVQAYHKKGLGANPSELRNLYRDVTGNPRDHNALFTELASKYPFDELKNVVGFLLKSLGYDLKSKGPSIQQAELMRLLTETRNLQSILWVYLFFKSRMKLLRSLFAKYGVKAHKLLTFEMLAKEYIKLVEERYPSVLRLLKQVQGMGYEEDGAQIAILMQFRDAIRQLSTRLYKSPKARQDLLIVILETLEDLEEEKEDEEEEDKKKEEKNRP